MRQASYLRPSAALPRRSAATSRRRTASSRRSAASSRPNLSSRTARQLARPAHQRKNKIAKVLLPHDPIFDQIAEYSRQKRARCSATLVLLSCYFPATLVLPGCYTTSLSKPSPRTSTRCASRSTSVHAGGRSANGPTAPVFPCFPGSQQRKFEAQIV